MPTRSKLTSEQLRSHDVYIGRGCEKLGLFRSEWCTDWCTFCGPALYEMLPSGVSMLCSSSQHRLPCRLENNDVASAGSYGMLGVPGLSCQAPKQDMPVA